MQFSEMVKWSHVDFIIYFLGCHTGGSVTSNKYGYDVLDKGKVKVKFLLTDKQHVARVEWKQPEGTVAIVFSAETYPSSLSQNSLGKNRRLIGNFII